MNHRLLYILSSVVRYNVLYTLFYLMCIGLFVLYFSMVKEEIVVVKAKPETKPPHTLCLIVPFRNRLEELLEFVPHISKFLEAQGIKFQINVINQVDENRFNRGALINAGFLAATEKYPDCDYIAMHDVDLLPLNSEISYDYPGENAFHVASPQLHPKYHYKTFIGGIMIISNEKFIASRGLSNRYWGWGLEDDEFFLRLKEKSIKIYRPSNLSTNETNTFKHIHGRHRKRDMERCFNQKAESLRRDRVTGLHDVEYYVVSDHSLIIDDFPITLFNIYLVCNHLSTPWCYCPENKVDNDKKKKSLAKKL